ncbi:MAG TPA: hypothetical protein ENI58_06915 [Nitrospirae bacterium]|nr:hypothetical protein [Nitrospirota bacterium]
MKTTDDFYNIINQYMGHIQLFYRKYEDKNPVMELSLPSHKIYAYPYSEYLKKLGKKDQKILKKEYNEASKNNKMVVFVRDEEEKVLKSSLFPIEDIDYVEQ